MKKKRTNGKTIDVKTIKMKAENKAYRNYSYLAGILRAYKRTPYPDAKTVRAMENQVKKAKAKWLKLKKVTRG